MNKFFIVLAALVSFIPASFANSDNDHVETVARSQPFMPTDHDQQICDQFAVQAGPTFLANNSFLDSVFPYRITFTGHVGHMMGSNIPTQTICFVNAYKSCDDIFAGYAGDGFSLTSCNEPHADMIRRLRALYPDALDMDYTVMGGGNFCKIYPTHLVNLYAN